MKTKADVIALLMQEKQVPRLLQAALEGDAQKATDLLSSGEATLEDADADGKMLMDYVNELGLWDFLGRAVRALPEVFAGVKITETTNFVASMYEERQLEPNLLQLVPWEELETVKLAGNAGTESAVEALSWLNGYGSCILEGLAGGRWQPQEAILKHLGKEDIAEALGFSRSQELFESHYDEPVRIVDENTASFVGTVKEVVPDYQLLDAEPYITVKDHAGGLNVVYGKFDVSPGDTFSRMHKSEYRCNEPTAYAW